MSVTSNVTVRFARKANYKLLLDIANSQNKKERLEAVVYGEVLCKPDAILYRPAAGLVPYCALVGAYREETGTACRASGWPGDEADVIPHSQP